AQDRGTSIRIGVNAGSLDKRLLEKHGKATPEALVESAKWEASLFEEHGFRDFKISVKHNDPVVMVRAYEMLAAEGDWPVKPNPPFIPGHEGVGHVVAVGGGVGHVKEGDRVGIPW
ncbi:flavodoxin-dependent (E)-4-hydroxy-3-methylbut-2-enyl-diphosphate synthase, partial [Klebsiella pneumoniae]|uniref:flavodoxin-dependent (E)-4-hydroxy-3-methylbut-2-enyl-diphosphate synthase n=1 Tax=Klebsiella pneumoniae TaxID=573 RepID=UPI003F28E8E0